MKDVIIIRKTRAIMYEVEYKGTLEEYAVMWSKLSDLCTSFQDSFLTLWFDRGDEYNYDFIRVTKDNFDRITVYVSVVKDCFLGMERYLESINLTILKRKEVIVGIPTINVCKYNEEKLWSMTSVSII